MRAFTIVAGLAGVALARPAATLTPAVRRNHHPTGLQEAQAHSLAAAAAASTSAAATATPSTVIETVLGYFADNRTEDLERMLDEKKIMLQSLETEKKISEAKNADEKRKLMDEKARLVQEVERLHEEQKQREVELLKQERREQMQRLVEENDRRTKELVEEKKEHDNPSPVQKRMASSTATATPSTVTKRQETTEEKSISDDKTISDDDDDKDLSDDDKDLSDDDEDPIDEGDEEDPIDEDDEEDQNDEDDEEEEEEEDNKVRPQPYCIDDLGVRHNVTGADNPCNIDHHKGPMHPSDLAKRQEDHSDDDQEDHETDTEFQPINDDDKEECDVSFWDAVLWLPAVRAVWECGQYSGENEDGWYYFPEDNKTHDEE